MAFFKQSRTKCFFEKEVIPIFSKVGENTKINLYDSEYFHSSVSDFMIINTTHLDEYELIIELLRDTKIYGAPYFDIKDIIIGQENLFESFNEKFKKLQIVNEPSWESLQIISNNFST